jgi:DNA-binding response OmpR family regulator
MAKVLVIEDDQPLRELLCLMLQSAGHETVEAPDGTHGFARFAGERPDLVITDLVMPEREGIETIQQIRELDETLPIIAISGMWGGEFEPLADAKLLGASVALQKPIARRTLLEEVSKLLGPIS